MTGGRLPQLMRVLRGVHEGGSSGVLEQGSNGNACNNTAHAAKDVERTRCRTCRWGEEWQYSPIAGVPGREREIMWRPHAGRKGWGFPIRGVHGAPRVPNIELVVVVLEGRRPLTTTMEVKRLR